MLHAHGPKSGTDTTAQLNQAELARLQAGNFTPPPVPPGPACLGRNEPDAGRRESDIEPDRGSLRPGPVNASSVGLVRDAAKIYAEEFLSPRAREGICFPVALPAGAPRAAILVGEFLEPQTIYHRRRGRSA